MVAAFNGDKGIIISAKVEEQLADIMAKKGFN